MMSKSKTMAAAEPQAPKSKPDHDVVTDVEVPHGHDTWMTLHSAEEEDRRVPLRRSRVNRTPGDVVLHRVTDYDTCMGVTLLLRADGTLAWWRTRPGGGDNPYWHVDEVRTGSMPAAPTEAQRDTVARMYLGEVRPFGLSGAVAAPLYKWALGDMDPQMVSDTYGDGADIPVA
jgi:hypothetical protein